MAARGMATAARMAGDEKGNGNSKKEGNVDQQRHHGQWPWRRGWQAFEGGNNGYGDEDIAQDKAACTAAGEKGMMLVMGHGLCVFWCVWRDHKKSKFVSVSQSL